MDIFTNKGDYSLNNSFTDAKLNRMELPFTDFNSNHTFPVANATMINFPPPYLKFLDHINVACYIIICVLGLIGNCLVIYVVLMYAKMKTVTNMYILNLAISDVMFLTMIPITVTTVIVKHWIFGHAMCKIFFLLSATNTFGSAFNLCVMSADRYLAVCHPISSIKYRTPRIALVMCLGVWVLCCLVMLPILMYTTTMKHGFLKGKLSCKLDWPDDHIIHPGKVFVWYSFILGYIVPVFLISIFYILIIVKLRRVAAAKKSTVTRRSHSRVTRLIFTVVAVYVTLWLPYWCFQIDGTINTIHMGSFNMILLINAFTILSLANSMLNPFLYAFLCENFRQSFLKAFKCCKFFQKTRYVCSDKTNCVSTTQTYMRTGSCVAFEERLALTVLEDKSFCSPEAGRGKMCLRDDQDDNRFLKPLTKL